mmetsp:Transcript_3654/g.11259  ORF Transcript_3654/g.11259 Transcript_3654/m.11259 type:complete len:212 (-) Transcript_3654:1842-2477(-)
MERLLVSSSFLALPSSSSSFDFIVISLSSSILVFCIFSMSKLFSCSMTISSSSFFTSCCSSLISSLIRIRNGCWSVNRKTSFKDGTARIEDTMRPFDDTDGVSFVSRNDSSSCSSFSFCFARSETDHVGEVSGSPRKRLLLGNCCESVISSSPKSRALPDIVRLSAAKGELDGLGLFFCAARAASFARISRICFVKIAPSKAVIERSLSNE